MHLIGRILNCVVFLAPVVALAIWAASYAAGCLIVLSAPGKNLRLEFETQGGPLLLKAESYSIEAFAGLIQARGVGIYDSEDRLIMGADSAVISAPYYFQISQSSVDVDLIGARAVIVRNENGDLELLKYFESKEPPKEPVPLSISVHSGRLTLIDRMTSPPTEHRYRVTNGRFESAENAWRASGRFNAEGRGWVDLSALWTSDQRLRVEGDAHTFPIETLWEHLRHLPDSIEWGEARFLTIETGSVDGRFTIEYQQGQEPFIRGRPRIQVRGLRTDYWSKPLDAVFDGWMTGRSAGGTLEADDGTERAAFIGQFAWASGFAMLGKLNGDLANISSVPPRLRSALPKNLIASGLHFDGTIHVSNAGRLQIGGLASVQKGSLGEHAVTDAQGVFAIDGDKVSVDLETAKWRDAEISGTVSLVQPKGALTGYVAAKDIDVEKAVGHQLGVRVRGTANVHAVLAGTLESPDADLRLDAAVMAEVEPGRWRRGTVAAGGKVAGSELRVERAVIRSGTSLAVAAGTVNLKEKSVSLQGTVSGLELGEYSERLAGLAMARLTLKGTFDKPIGSGRVEVYNASFEGEGVPILVGDLGFDRNELTVRDISAVRGASRLDGALTFDFKTHELDGRFEGRGIQISDFVDGDVVGGLDIRNLVLGGTLETPTAKAEVVGSDLVASGVRVDSVVAELQLAGDMIQASRVTISAKEGSWTGSGWYSLSGQNGSVTGFGANLPLEILVPILPGETLVAGRLDLTTNATIFRGEISEAGISGRVADLRVNPTLIGQGTFAANFDGTAWTGNAEVGQIDRFIQVPSFRYEPKSDDISAELVVLNLPVKDVYQSIRPELVRSVATDPPEARASPDRLLALMDRANGSIGASVVFAGKAHDPIVEVRSAEVEAIHFGDDDAGKITFAARRDPGGEWSQVNLIWTLNSGQMSASGQFEESGEIDIRGDLNNFDPRWLAFAEPRLASVPGVASIAFDITGDTHRPNVVATANASLLPAPMEPNVQGPPDYRLAINLDARLREGSLSLEGGFNSRGIRGGIDGRIPFRYPANIPEDEPVDLHLSVPPRRRGPGATYIQDPLDLRQFSDYMANLKLGGDTHTLIANISLGGTIGDLSLAGTAEAKVSDVSYEGLETRLNDLTLKAGIDGNRITVNGQAQVPGRGKAPQDGAVTVTGSMTIPDLLDDLEFDQNRLLASNIRARVRAKGVRIRERDEGTGLDVDVIANGEVSVTGPLESPLFATTIPLALANLQAEMPAVFPVAAVGAPPRINPRFSIAYVVGSADAPASVKAVTASFGLHGSGSITGTLTAPVASASFLVDSGTIRLPNARVRIEEGGSVRFLYRGRELEQSEVRLDMDLHGRTALSSVRLGGIVQRYDIQLAMRGNLLDESSQFIQATSDPPDLDQAQILNLLGQRQLFETLANQFLGQRSDQQLAQALAGVALPVVFDSFTQRVADELGLEYIQLEYNAFEGATVTAAKTLGKGFTLQGRRQVTEMQGNRLNWDLRLTYRPPSKYRQLKNVIFSLGADQDRPWKIAVEYGIRF